jgi:Holliday junction resolvase RusA-like endonuclease
MTPAKRPEIILTIPGVPFGKQRARATRGGRMYTPAATVSFERLVGTIAAPHFPQPLDGPVRVEIVATFAPPPSWSQKKRAALLHRPHTQKPDLDNVAKAILDGLNRIAFADDSQVADQRLRKMWGLTAQTVVYVEQIGVA